MTAAELLAACRVPTSVRARRIGLWEIRRLEIDPWVRAYMEHRGVGPVPADQVSLTMLFRDTIGTLHETHGACVMEDSPQELRRHLPILLTARGRVLVSGLGLGCVLRGLLAKPDVEHVDVVEIDPAICDLVWDEFRGNKRVTLYLDDAEQMRWPAHVRWDYAWHDVWSEHEALDLVHARMLVKYADRVRHQGAWQFDRRAKNLWPRPLLGQARYAQRRAQERAA